MTSRSIFLFRFPRESLLTHSPTILFLISLRAYLTHRTNLFSLDKTSLGTPITYMYTTMWTRDRQGISRYGFSEVQLINMYTWKSSKYRGMDISYEDEVDVRSKICKFLKNHQPDKWNTKRQQNETWHKNKKSLQHPDSTNADLWVAETWALQKSEKQRKCAFNLFY